MADRIAQIRERLDELGADVLLLTFLPDIRWACGFTGSNGMLLVRRDDAVFLTDGRYKTQAADEVQSARVVIAGYDLPGYAAEHDLLAGCRTAAFQADHVTVDLHSKLLDLFEDVDWTGVKEVLVRNVAQKSRTEIARIEAAQRLTEDVFEQLCGWIQVGMSEKEIAAEIVYRHLRAGAEGMSFEPIVASGSNSALPHARPGDRKLQRGDVLLLDFGCFLDGYASDMTRTVAIGEAAGHFRDIYHLVLAAQEQAIATAHAGMDAKELDAVARDVIKEGGHGDDFSHSLGHGLGLQIHEWPRVSYAVDYALPADCAVTMEPGIYLPGQFGIRIEDIVVLREDGCENLTRAPKDLLIL